MINSDNNLSRKEKLLLYKQQKLNQNENVNPSSLSSNIIKNKQLLIKSKKSTFIATSNIVNSIKKPIGSNIDTNTNTNTIPSSSLIFPLSNLSTNIHKSKVNILQNNNDNDIAKATSIQNDQKQFNINISPNINDSTDEIRLVMGENGLDKGELANPHILSFPIDDIEITNDDSNNDKCCMNINMLLGNSNNNNSDDEYNKKYSKKDANIRVIVNRDSNKSRISLKESIFKLNSAFNNAKKINNDKIVTSTGINIINNEDKIIHKCDNEMVISNVKFTTISESNYKPEIIEKDKTKEIIITNKDKVAVKDEVILMEGDTKLITQHVPMPRRRGLKKTLVKFDQNSNEVDNKLVYLSSDQTLKKRKGTPYKVSKFVLSSYNLDDLSQTRVKVDEEGEEMDIDCNDDVINNDESNIMTPIIRRSRRLSHFHTHS